MASVHDTIIEQGSTWTRIFNCQKADGSPVDLVGATARMQFRATMESTAVLFSATFAIDGLAGQVTATVAPEASSAVNVAQLEQGKLTEGGVVGKGGMGVYDLEIVIPDDESTRVIRVIQGRVVITPEVTR